MTYVKPKKEDYELVHKVFFLDSNAQGLMGFIKVVNKEDMKDIRIFGGIFPWNTDGYSAEESMNLIDVGIEIATGSLDIFLTKNDYTETNILQSAVDTGVVIKVS